MKKLFCGLFLIPVILLTSCASSFNKSSSDIANSGYSEYQTPEYAASNAAETGGYYDGAKSGSGAPAVTTQTSSGTPGTSGTVTDTRKIIKNVSIALETKTFDDAVNEITSLVSFQGGYIESSYVSGQSMNGGTIQRYATFTVRIPAEKLDDYVNSLGTDYNVLSKSENSSDITDVYFDTQAKLDSLLTQETRLLKMLEGATELKYMLELEDTLADVRYKIESYYSTMKRYDSQISMSTVSIKLNEVVEYKPITEAPKTFGEKLIKAVTESWKEFADGMQAFAIDFVYAIPTLLLLAVIILILALVIKAVRRGKRGGRNGNLYARRQEPNANGTDNASGQNAPPSDGKNNNQ